MSSSVSAIITREEDGKIFIGRRALNKEYAAGKWETIGGSIEKGETAEEALTREVKEELAVKIKHFQYFGDYQYKDRTFRVFIVKLDKEPVPNKDDFADWGWFPESEIVKMDFAINCKEKLLDYFRNKRP